MVGEVRGVDSALPESVRAELPRGSLSQWQLISMRFARHRVAVASLFMLLSLYSVALFAEFVAPYGPYERHLDYPYAPPQALHFDFERGLHTYALEPHVDPVTFRKHYVELPNEPVALRPLRRGAPYRLWGLIPLERRLLAVEGAGQPEAAAQKGGIAPTFFLLGADRYGRDVFSRIVYGARVSLSVGMI